jgi:hypothetical protein
LESIDERVREAASHPDPPDHALNGAAAPLHPSIPRRVEEATYLTAPNAERYRVILHFFYEQYGEQRDWLSVEQVWHHVRACRRGLGVPWPASRGLASFSESETADLTISVSDGGTRSLRV